MTSTSVRTVVFVHCLALFLAITLSGCAFGTRHVLLTYQPLRPPGSPKGVTIFIAPFEDRRQTPQLVGHVLNGYGWKTAKIKTRNEVSQWVHDALAAELRNTGYDVAVNGTPEAAMVSGKVLHVDCTSYWTYEGTVNLEIEVRRGHNVLLQKTYLGEADRGLVLALRAKSYGAVLEEALQVTLGKAVNDLEGVLAKGGQ